MHLQIRSRVVSGSNPPGAMSVREGADGVTVIQPGRLLRLLELLAQDQRESGDGYGPFSLIAAAGSNIETTGEFAFVVAAESHEQEEEQHKAALARIRPEFPDSDIHHRDYEDLPHKAGSLYNFIAKYSNANLLIDEIIVGVSNCSDGTKGEVTVPVQVHALRMIDR
jgi:hypothetical protein